MPIIAWLVFIGVLCTPWAEATALSSRCNDCNVILISIDTLRADHLGAYGYPVNTSPNLDRLASRSVVFEEAYSTSSWTLPAHVSMLSGKYPQKFQVEVPRDPVPDRAVMLAETLRENGYHTACFTTGPFVLKEFGFNQGFDKFEQSQNWQDADQIVSQTTNWLKANASKRFFLFLHSFHIHDPYSPSGESLKRLGQAEKSPLDGFSVTHSAKITAGELKLTEDQEKRVRALYDAEIREIDESMGRIFEYLDKLGLAEKTIVLVTSDHGEEFGERGQFGVHAYSLYQELVRVPFILHLPNRKKGARIKGPVSLVDIYPTLLDLLGIKYTSKGLDGVNLRVTPERALAKRTIYAETIEQRYWTVPEIEELYKKFQAGKYEVHARPITDYVSKLRMLLNGGYKLIRQPNGKYELYDLRADPGEKKNLAGKKLPIEAKLKKNVLMK